jgi:signal transduction histidine kinase
VLQATPSYIVYDLAVGFTGVYISLVVWESRPSNRIGPLLFMYSAWFLLSPVRLIPNVGWISLGWIVQSAVQALFVHIVLAYPSGRLQARLDRTFVAVVYTYTIGMPLIELTVAPARDLFGCPGSVCPARPPLLVAHESLFQQLTSVDNVFLGVAALIFLALIARRYVLGSPRRRRQVLPVTIVAFLAAINAVVSQYIPSTNTGPWQVADIGDHAIHLGFAVALLAGFYASRLERSHIADLLVRFAGAHADSIEPLLAPVLRDPHLRLGIWDRDGRRYMDRDGAELAIVSGDRDRVLTKIDGDEGEPLAALIHERTVLDDPQLTAAMIAAARLALENERLHERVGAQLAEVRASRARMMQAGDNERRRLERDLHDGAQQRLLAVGMALQLARDDVGEGGTTARLLREAEVELEAALDELRQLARGIHPAVLTDQGLAGAVRALVERSPVPVELVALPEQRLPEPVEKAVYFLVCEALQNIAKHSRANQVRVSIAPHDGHVRVAVTDDGVGGANPELGSGLNGLRDRIEAVDGVFAVASEPGGGTVVSAELPCEL